MWHSRWGRESLLEMSSSGSGVFGGNRVTTKMRQPPPKTPDPFRLALAFALVLPILALSALADDPAGDFATAVKPFLTTYCVSCHGATKQKGDRRFDELTGEIADDNGLVDLQDIVDQLNLGEMPPPKEKKQPTGEERRKITAWLTARIE